MILCIDTATPVCSVALVGREGVAGIRQSDAAQSHASLLTVFAGELLDEHGLRASDLEAVAVSKGPGSYTGLRIGVSAAKGIAFGAGIPLISVGTHYSMFLGIRESALPAGFDSRNCIYVPMLDARRMEVFMALFGSDGDLLKDVCAMVIDENSLSDIPEDRHLLLFGTGAAKCSGILKRGNTFIAGGYTHSASSMRKAAYDAFDRKAFEDVAYFEPFYLKDFIATVPRKNIVA